MATQDIINYYAGLLIIEYLNKPKAYATIQTVVDPVIMDQLPVAVQNAYAVTTAQGVQLDIIGKYVGATRYVYSFVGPVTLDDADFLQLIRLKIVQNNQFSSTAAIQSLVNTFFGMNVRFYDFQDMSVEYLFESAFGSNQLAEIMIEGGFLPKPMACNLRATIYVPTGALLFSFSTALLPAPTMTTSGFSSASGFVANSLWLSSVNVI